MSIAGKYATILTGCGRAPGEEAYTTGNTYYYGEGVEQNYAKALEYYEQAASEGGQWYMKAAEAGKQDAMWHVGEFYFEGIAVEQDLDKAKEWYDKAVKAGTSMDWYEE